MENEAPKSQRVVITLPYEMYVELKALADFNRRPMSEEVRISIENRLKTVKHPKEKQSSEELALAVA